MPNAYVDDMTRSEILAELASLRNDDGPCVRKGWLHNGSRRDEDGKWWCRRRDPFLKDGREAGRRRRDAARIAARELE